MRTRIKTSLLVLSGLGVGTLGALADGCVSSGGSGPSSDAGTFDSATSTFDSASPPQDAGTDATIADAGTDTGTDTGTVVVQDSGNDTGTDAGFDAGCSPAVLTGWTPPAYVHAAGVYANQCDQTGVLAEYWQDCLGDAASPATCATFPDAGIGNGACATCIVTPPDAGVFGPEVVFVVPQTNVAGCIELADPTDAGFTCAEAIQAAQACVEASCAPSCPVTSDPATAAAYVACTKLAASSTCAAFAGPASACITSEIADGGPTFVYTTCLSTSDPQTLFDDIATYFCAS